jgi:glycosyltransferase involved in cell wall biosynthesis
MALQQGNQVNYCVLIPTYNNDRTLEDVILSTLDYTSNIIVIDDGSDDNTSAILERFKDKIHVASNKRNKGKGAALKKGFRCAQELGYEYAISLDSDGQHFPSEIPKFLERVRPGQDILIIGNRDMIAESVPKKSLFGRKFSNFWVKLETNLDLKDTQSGYRLYTVAKMNSFRFFTSKYDFELEALVRWAWRDYPIDIVDIKVYYPSPEERVTHFSGFKDNLRISLLNTALVAVLLVHVIPRSIFRILIQMMRNISEKFMRIG